MNWWEELLQFQKYSYSDISKVFNNGWHKAALNKISFYDLFAPIWWFKSGYANFIGMNGTAWFTALWRETKKRLPIPILSFPVWYDSIWNPYVTNPLAIAILAPYVFKRGWDEMRRHKINLTDQHYFKWRNKFIWKIGWWWMWYLN